MRKTLFAVFVLIWSFVLGGQDFSIADFDNLKLDCGGRRIVSGEVFSMFPEGGFPGSSHREESVSGMEISNRWGKAGRVDYRREIVLKNGGREVEINFQMHFPSYEETLIGQRFSYSLLIPFSELTGSAYSAIVGRSSKISVVNGTFIDTPEGGLPAGTSGSLFTSRGLFINGKLGKIAIDCDPNGINCHGDYGPNNVVGMWIFKREGDYLECRLDFIPKFFGGTQSGKVVIYAGDQSDYDKRHAHRSYRYFSEMPPDRNYVFGAEKFGKKYENGGTAGFSSEKGFGWEGELPVAEVFKPQGALYAAVKGNGDGVFRMDGLRQGFHIITVAAGAWDGEAGPFSISCNGKVFAQGLTIAQRTATTVTFGTWIEDGTARLKFSGNWRVSTIGDQLLQASAEDYTFRRGFWASDKGPYPSVMLQNSAYTPEPAAAVRIDSFVLPEPGQETAGMRKTWTMPSCHAEFDNPGEDWRGRAIIGSVGPGNNGNFDEFATPEKLRRRMDELKENRIDAILVNGFLSRHTFPSHLKRTENAIRDITRLAHERGITVIDHQDYSLLWNKDSGFRVMVERMPHLQMTVDGHLPARGLCPVNPDSLKLFFDTLEAHVLATGIDGIMVDECSFHTDNFCGCSHCRGQFHAETGWYLPADELSPELFSRDSLLWRTWLTWRQKKIGDFWYQLKSRLKAHNKKFVAMGYTTHYGLISTYGSLGHGAAMEQTGRGWDFIGTEIMSRNIHASYRGVQSYRKVKNHMRNTEGVPIFGLVYSSASDWDVLYFGWALNNMNAQATWEMSGVVCPEGKSNYRLFKEDTGNMRLRESVPMSNIALVFSAPSRDWARYVSYPPDMLGVSQLLSSRHIQHEFINEKGLTAAGLKGYKVLFLNNIQAISDGGIAAAKDFAMEGGTLVVTNRTGQSDEMGTMRKEWPFDDVLPGLKPNLNRNIKMDTFDNRGESITSEVEVFGVECRMPADLTVLWTGSGKDGKQVPALVQAKLGKGRIIYSPFSMGTPAYCPEFTSKAPFTFTRKPRAEKICNMMLDTAVADMNVWNPGNTPEKVLTSVYKDGEETVIHFLNATGSNMQPGEIVPGTPIAPAYPALTEDIVFSIQLSSVKSAYAVSPDFKGPVPLAVSKENGSYKITLPKERLSAYTLVHLVP